MKQKQPTLLIVEDDAGLRSQLKWHFDQYKVVEADTRERALELVERYQPAVVLQDLGLPPAAEGVSEGMACISQILDINADTKILVMTGRDEKENAIKAISLGALDFFHKPVDPDLLDTIVERSLRVYELQAMAKQEQPEAADGLQAELSANDLNMVTLTRTLKRLAPTEITCTLIGESGVGKEVIANAIHRHSSRASGKFMAINCASIPAELIESELFGYEKGAFTGAAKRTEGKIEATNGGTLFLDEIGDMPLQMQAKLLRFLQERKVQRVGATSETPVDVRVICATNKDLASMSQEGTFREDLYYRICEYVINIPPLRERQRDIMALAEKFLKATNQKYNLRLKGFSDSAKQMLLAYNWPGNVRELESKINITAVMCDGQYISAEDLALPIHCDACDLTVDECIDLKQARKAAEVEAIERALSLTDNLSEAAKLLKVSRPTLYDMLKKYDIATGA